MKRTINQDRAIAYFLKQHPNLALQMGVGGLSIGFRDKVTGKTFDKSLQHLELGYNNYLKDREEKT